GPPDHRPVAPAFGAVRAVDRDRPGQLEQHGSRRLGAGAPLPRAPHRDGRRRLRRDRVRRRFPGRSDGAGGRARPPPDAPLRRLPRSPAPRRRRHGGGMPCPRREAGVARCRRLPRPGRRLCADPGPDRHRRPRSARRGGGAFGRPVADGGPASLGGCRSGVRRWAPGPLPQPRRLLRGDAGRDRPVLARGRSGPRRPLLRRRPLRVRRWRSGRLRRRPSRPDRLRPPQGRRRGRPRRGAGAPPRLPRRAPDVRLLRAGEGDGRRPGDRRLAPGRRLPRLDRRRAGHDPPTADGEREGEPGVSARAVRSL
ncbi:MAG: Inosose dehydratase, partial [uncultured Thermomicrobiales bacterium]